MIDAAARERLDSPMNQDVRNQGTSELPETAQKDMGTDLFLDEPIVMNVQEMKEAAKLARQEERWKKREERQAKRDQKKQDRWEKREKEKSMDTTDKVGVSDWFVTICLTNIPIVNIIYLICTALNKNKPQPKRSFAFAFILYRILVWVLAFTVLYMLLLMGTDFVDGILNFLDDYRLLG